MTLEEARAVWLLRMGSRGVSWVERFRIRQGDDAIITEAHDVLADNKCFYYDPVTRKIHLNANPKQ